MKTPIFATICAALSLGATEIRAAGIASAEQAKKEKSSASPKSIACAQEVGEALGQCTYRIKQDDKGKTTVTVAFANGFKRRLFFEDGTFLKANTTMSGTGTDADWSLEDGTHKIRVDDQRYEVPDSLIEGN